ncbi:galectin-8-like [Toxorhynchites rutilus septentrionalis]|uniref:galectin-8-like n=1 Tax=Toxorhynchites rutilus septentrionalis TaxID=329112 RepID=UPI00247AE8B8|nr:galectin-8-like [Toxorhynchites rutilus septentrionalis]
MLSERVLSPSLPFMGKLPGVMQPASRIRIRGSISIPNGDCRIQLQSGDSLSPMDDVALQLSILPATREVLRNSHWAGQWGQEERIVNSPINFEEEFDLVIEANTKGFMVEIGGSTLATFPHRCPVQIVQFIFITGGCVIRAVIYENWNTMPTKATSVLPSAPIYNGFLPSQTTPLPPFQIPSWPHGSSQYFSPSPVVYSHVPPPAYNPAMFFQHPFAVNIPSVVQKSVESASTLQHKIFIAILWKICCILLKTIKFILFVSICGLGLYILSRRLRL